MNNGSQSSEHVEELKELMLRLGIGLEYSIQSAIRNGYLTVGSL